MFWDSDADINIWYLIMKLIFLPLDPEGGSQTFFVQFLPTNSVFFFFFLYKNFFRVELIYNVVLVSGVQQIDSVIHKHISILFQILFSYRLLQNIE